MEKLIKNLLNDVKLNNFGAKSLLKAAVGIYAPRNQLKKAIKAYALWSAASWAVRKLKNETLTRAFEQKKAESDVTRSS